MSNVALQRFQEDCERFFSENFPEEMGPLLFGSGLKIAPTLMLIGEAPGAQELKEGKPFVGRAGQNLTLFLEILGVQREDIYITNAVKIRPTKTSEAGRISNRPPTGKEQAAFRPWLLREVMLVRPKALVTLGNVALNAFLPDTVGRCHGKWHQIDIALPESKVSVFPLFSLYHPASVIYRPELKKAYQQDLEILRDTFLSLQNG